MKKGVERFSDDKVLLKLYRIYGKDEALKHLFDEISKLRFQVGELKSENAELEHKVTHKTSGPTGVRHWSYDEYVMELKNLIKAKAKKNSILERDMNRWRNDYFNLLLKSEPTDEPSVATDAS
jgi:flagellar biosynthesis chaperone FliJ